MCFSVQVERDLKKLAYRFDAKINDKAFDNFYHLQKNAPDKYQFAHDEDSRIFAKTWAPIICSVNGERQVRPMRYQLLPGFSPTEKYLRVDPKTNKEVEIKSTYNARIDSLQSARAWQKPFMNFHAVLPIKKFYEWVPKNGHKSIISFEPKNDEYLLAPCLYDNWFSEDKQKIIQSFAIITDNAVNEVMEQGHDRTPISLSEDNLDKWLNPQNHEDKYIIDILNSPKHDEYSHNWLI